MYIQTLFYIKFIIVYYAIHETFYLVYYMYIAILIGLIIGGVCLLFSSRVIEYDLGSAYECGFEPFEEPHRPFTVVFYLVGLLFVLFDIEFLLIMPWCVIAEYGDIWNWWFFLIVFFEFILIGYLFEWCRGAISMILR